MHGVFGKQRDMNVLLHHRSVLKSVVGEDTFTGMADIYSRSRKNQVA